MRFAKRGAMTRSLFLVPALVGGFALLPGQQPISWQIQPPTAAPLGPLSRAAGTYDSTAQSILWLEANYPANHTLEWTPGGWTDHGATPLVSWGATSDVAMAHDPVSHETLVFGGWTYPVLSNKTHRWTGSAWAQLTPATLPSPRREAGLFFDPGRQHLVLVAGTGNNGILPWNPTLDLADTWEWSGSDWVPLAPAHQPTAGPCLVAFDASRNRAVLLPRLGSTMWEWDGSDWSEVLPSLMPPLSNVAGMVFDASRGRVLLQAGATWEWDGVDWTQVTAADPDALLPIVFAGTLQRTVLVGHGVWLSNNTSPQHIASATTYGSGCGTPELRLESISTDRLPLLGRPARVRLAPLPVSVPGSTTAWMSVGFSQLTGIAWPTPNCDVHQSSEVIGLPCTFSGDWSLNIPYDVSLLDLDLYLQGVALAPGQNEAWLVLSNGMHWRVGDN